jgi:ankyrin repeat protein
MKTNWLIGSVFLAVTMVLHAQTNDLNAALQKGLFEEEANHNLDAAISNYQSLATQFDRDRQVAATAIFRLGECYRKLGRDNDAVVQYQRIVREFPDQQTLAMLSQQNLTGLGTTPQATSPSTTTSESTARTAELEAEAAALKAQITHLSSLSGANRRIAVQQNFPNAVLTTLVQQLAEAEQKLASLTNEYSSQAVPVVNAIALVNTINQQIDAQVDGVVKGLQAKMEADVNAAKALRDKSGLVTVAHTEASTVTDDEEQEIRRIQQLIQNSPDLINATTWRLGSKSTTPLMRAADAGRLRVATFLLDHGADINIPRGGAADNSSEGWTALHHAAFAGNRAMVELLLSRGADVSARDLQGQTPLHIAADKGFQAVTEVLLANKADVNVTDKNAGNAPLHLAAKNGREKIIQMLLAAGATPNVENSQGRTPLSIAAESGSPEIVKILLAAKADPNGGKLDAPLLVAIHKQDAGSAKLLLENGANPNAKGENDWQPSALGAYGRPVGRGSETPLSLAVSTKQLPMVNLLLKFKADPNDSQTDGRSLLFSTLSDTNILETLLDAGAKVDVYDRNETFKDVNVFQPLLNAAVAVKNATSVGLLLKHGANANSPDNNGYTPLHVAATYLAEREIFELLLAGKADPNVRNHDGKTPLDLLKEYIMPNTGAPGRPPALGIGGEMAGAQQIKLAGELADLLRQHGALDNLPHWDHIEVSRPSANYSQTVFQKGTNDWNRFTLLETLLNFYPGKSPSPGSDSVTSLPLPDLSRLTIIRHKPKNTNETRIQVNLLNATNGIDGSRDMPLEFGDVVEVPEREHALGDRPIGLTDSQHDDMVNCLKGSVRLVVHGGKVELPVYPYPDGSLIGSVLKRPEAQGILLSSSDLSRVKVTRHDPVTGKRCEWVVNCAPWLEAVPAGAGSTFAQRLRAVTERGRNNGQLGAAPDLWLRDGDVIEVPEKP